MGGFCVAIFGGAAVDDDTDGDSVVVPDVEELSDDIDDCDVLLLITSFI